MSTGYNGLLVNHAALQQIQNDIRQAVQAVDDRLNRLESELAPLRSDWTGEARLAYDVSKGKWDAAIQDMKVLLNDAGTQVGESDADFTRVDNAAAQRMSGAY